MPPKVKVFAWHTATDSLAVQMNRKKHHQVIQDTCNICGSEDEEIFHALVNCT